MVTRCFKIETKKINDIFQLQKVINNFINECGPEVVNVSFLPFGKGETAICMVVDDDIISDNHDGDLDDDDDDEIEEELLNDLNRDTLEDDERNGRI